MNNALHTPIQYLKGVGPKRAKTFNKLGISSVEDLLYYFPRRYQDRTRFSPISQLEEGQSYSIKARILARGQRQSLRKRGFSITEAAVGDQSGKIACVWFNRPYLADYLKVGRELILYGKVERYGSRLQMSSPEFEFVSEEDSTDADRFVPVYPLPEGVTQRYLRRSIKEALGEFLPRANDFLPYDIRAKSGLLNLAQSLINIHFPQSLQMQREAYRRLAFEEFFLFQLPILLRKQRRKYSGGGIAHKIKGPLLEAFLGSLPFELTAAQNKALEEITRDMASPFPMQRLLQGDVGCGKTVVAAAACIIAIQGGYQAAFMAPTEILAAQHYKKISSEIRNQKSEIRICLLTSGIPQKEKNKLYRDIKEGRFNLIIGTHALLEGKIEFNNLGLAVIDEQHKFGVAQRALLPEKGAGPDLLIMTATPIPRTLAITLYGDLDISVIDELPAGRLPVKTLSLSSQEKSKAYELARQELESGNQVYLVYPVIEESYALDIAGAKKMYERFKAVEFKGYRVGLIHGRLKREEQELVISKFSKRKLDLLVATTVLEVGIDIPGATCMLIEDAQRFGLAQLHQLRGRIGRGGRQSLCILIAGAAVSGEAAARLAAMVKYADGFRIAEEDLKIRGPGEFFGRRQSGLSELKIADPLRQMRLLKEAREALKRLLAGDPRLQMRQNLALKEELLQRFPEYEKFIFVG